MPRTTDTRTKFEGAEPILADVVAVSMVPPERTALNAAVNAIQSLVVVQDSGQPKIALLQNTPAAFHGRPELGEQRTSELTEVLHSGQVVQTG